MAYAAISWALWSSLDSSDSDYSSSDSDYRRNRRPTRAAPSFSAFDNKPVVVQKQSEAPKKSPSYDDFVIIEDDPEYKTVALSVASQRVSEGIHAADTTHYVKSDSFVNAANLFKTILALADKTSCSPGDALSSKMNFDDSIDGAIKTNGSKLQMILFNIKDFNVDDAFKAIYAVYGKESGEKIIKRIGLSDSFKAGFDEHLKEIRARIESEPDFATKSVIAALQ